MLYIVTPVWNGAEEFERMFYSLQERAGIDYRLVVVENGSDPDESDAVERLVQPFSPNSLHRMIWTRRNIGIPAAQNLALDYIESRHDGPYDVLLLSSDTEVSRGSLVAMQGFLNCHPDVGIVGGSRSPKGNGQPIFHHPNGHWYVHRDIRLTSTMGASGESVDFSSAMLRWELLERGLRFDEGYPVYDGYDQDLTFRVRSWGWDVVAIEADIIHYGSSVMKRRGYRWEAMGPDGDMMGGGREKWDRLRADNRHRFAEIWEPFLAPRRPSPEAEREHLSRMNRKLVEEAGDRKKVPPRLYPRVLDRGGMV